MATSSELERFVRRHIRSVWAVELLLVMRRDRLRSWTPAELVSELRASAGLVADILQGFLSSGLVTCEGDGFGYAPATPAAAAACDELETAYRERPVAVINMIARPADPLQSLADAFKFKGGDK